MSLACDPATQQPGPVSADSCRAGWGPEVALSSLVPPRLRALVVVCAKHKTCLRSKAFGRLKQEGCYRFKASPGCMVKPTIK